MLLVTIGIVMVYSSSAAIAAREQRLVEMRRSSGEPETLSATEKASQATDHSFYYLERQVIWAGVGLIALYAGSRIDYEKYKKYATPFLIFSFLCCVAVLVPHVGVAHKGARRWIGMGSFQVQVSEIAKLAMILYMAKKLVERRQDLRSFGRGFLPCFLILGLFCAVIVVEPDLGAAVVLATIAFFMFFAGGMRLIHLSTLGIVSVPAVVAAIIAEPYRMRRILAFLHPEEDISGKGYQLWQSLISVGTGGWTGLGLGKGPQKYLFLSEAYTDFIYAVICEELGLIGAGLVILIFVFFVLQGFRVARVAAKAGDGYGSLIATGITTMIGFQAFVNIAVVTGMVPTKGLTLPLISYGGSSLVINLLAVGILMNVSNSAETAVAAPTRRRALPAYA